MDSRTFIDAIPDYLEGQLPPAEQCAFERHRRTYPSDEQYYQSYVAVIRLCRDSFAPGPATPCSEVLAERIMNTWTQTKHENT